MNQFQETTGWSLTYHCADSVPAFLQSEDWEGKKISTKPASSTSEPLTPEILAEIDQKEECWLPVDVHTEFQNLIFYPSRDSEASAQPKVSPTLRFLQQPIGFLHLARRKKGPTITNPKDLSFSCIQFNTPKSAVSNSVFNAGKEISFEKARRYASSIRDMIAEMQIIRIHLWLLEVNSAANVPIFDKTVPFQNEMFAGNFRRLLEFSVDSLDLAAIGIYLFDAKHRQFRLRAHVGLSMDSYMQGGRKFSKSQADLRAYDHEHIVIHDATIPEDLQFQMPEAFESGVCMPLRTDRSKFGTVWFFSNQKVFPEETIQHCQLTAELLALSIEREAFLRRYGRTVEYRSELKKASDLQTIQTPVQVPGRRNFALKGRICLAPSARNPFKDSQKTSLSLNEEIVSGDFYDWFTLPDGQTLVVLGSVGICGIAGAFLAAAVRAALRSHAQYQTSASEILEKVHQTLWKQLGASARISLFCGILNQEGSYVALHFAQVGTLRALRVDGNSFSRVNLSSLETQGFLGGSSDFHCFVDSLYLTPGESLVIFNDGLDSALEIPPSNVRVEWEKIRIKDPQTAANQKEGAPFEGVSSQEIVSLVFDENESERRKKCRTSKKFEMMKNIVDVELGQCFCEKLHPTASLLALQATNYFEKHVTKTKSDQSVLVIQHLPKRKSEKQNEN
ncbi:MAG: SpoIIE family protein phosphatase [Thermoguttaceae bacterium]|nr:SpoIIE family protein phosphatase [Thermoguttaceae bacterium]